MSTVESAVLPLAHLTYEEELAFRHGLVREAFRKGRVDAEVEPVIPSPLQRGYRARVRLRVGPGGKLGHFLPGTHTFTTVDLTQVARPEVAARASELDGKLPPGSTMELRSDGARVVVVTDARARVTGDALVAGKRIGDPGLRVGGLRVSPRSFFQVNLEINARIVADVDAELLRLAPTRLLDLYAGVGNLSAPAVRRGVAATLVEQERSSAEDARFNLPAAEVLTRDAGRWTAGERFFDVALLDPPRAGAPELLPTLTVTRPRAILYLSCDPVTLARDVRQAIERRYRLVRVQPYDMFPGTEHVETLAILERVDVG
jgi:tRNA/tmRNA/rRNA uracil-C5-methylase (TrmA/RlmC/RlmD family)